MQDLSLNFLDIEINHEVSRRLLRAGLIVTTIMFVVFLPEFCGFPYWNHDLIYLKHFKNLNITDGRWFGDVVGWLTFNDMIPPLALLWAHLFRSAGAVFIVYFLSRSEKVSILVLGALAMTLSPENLPHYLYRYQTIMYPVPFLFLPLGFLIVERGNVRDIAIGYFLILCAFGANAAAVNSAIVLILGKMLFDMAQGDFWNLRSHYQRYLLVFTAGAVTQYGIVFFLRKLHYIYRYNTESAAPHEIFPNLVTVSKQAFLSFSPFANQAYTPAAGKLLILAMVAISLVTLSIKIVRRDGVRTAGFALGIVVAMIIGSRIAFAITNSYTFHYRVGAYGDIILQGFFVIFLLALVYHRLAWRFIAGLTLLLIYIFVVQSFFFERHTRDQFLVDVLYAQRVVDRIEKLEGLDPAKEYYIVFIGTQPYVTQTLLQQRNFKTSIGELEKSTMGGAPDIILRYIAPYLKLRNLPLKFAGDSDFQEMLKRHARQYTWPANESVKLFGNTILCVLDNAVMTVEKN